MEERLPSTHKVLGSALGLILELRKAGVGRRYEGEEPGTQLRPSAVLPSPPPKEGSPLDYNHMVTL